MTRTPDLWGVIWDFWGTGCNHSTATRLLLTLSYKLYFSSLFCCCHDVKRSRIFRHWWEYQYAAQPDWPVQQRWPLYCKHGHGYTFAQLFKFPLLRLHERWSQIWCVDASVSHKEPAITWATHSQFLATISFNLRCVRFVKEVLVSIKRCKTSFVDKSVQTELTGDYDFSTASGTRSYGVSIQRSSTSHRGVDTLDRCLIVRSTQFNNQQRRFRLTLRQGIAFRLVFRKILHVCDEILHCLSGEDDTKIGSHLPPPIWVNCLGILPITITNMYYLNFSDGMSYETSLTLFSLSHWSNAVRSQFMVGRSTTYSCSTLPCKLRFETMSGTNPFLIDPNIAYNRETDTYSCQSSGAHLVSWSVGVDTGKAVRIHIVISYLIITRFNHILQEENVLERELIEIH